MSINHKVIFIDKTDQKKKDMFFCSVCTAILSSKDDFDVSKTYECCYDCYLTFAESRKKEWENGWRPDKTKIKEYIYNRKKIIKYS